MIMRDVSDFVHLRGDVPARRAPCCLGQGFNDGNDWELIIENLSLAIEELSAR
jgi:hypothetical protein